MKTKAHSSACRRGVGFAYLRQYRLRRRVRQEGELALEDHRQGVAYKLPPPVRQWIVTYCQEHPHTTSRVLQGVLREHCDVLVSLGYLNQVRATLGVGYQRPPQGKSR